MVVLSGSLWWHGFSLCMVSCGVFAFLVVCSLGLFPSGFRWFMVGYGCYLGVSTRVKVRGSMVANGCSTWVVSSCGVHEILGLHI